VLITMLPLHGRRAVYACCTDRLRRRHGEEAARATAQGLAGCWQAPNTVAALRVRMEGAQC
jgi:hypothetical protein